MSLEISPEHVTDALITSGWIGVIAGTFAMDDHGFAFQEKRGAREWIVGLNSSLLAVRQTQNPETWSS